MNASTPPGAAGATKSVGDIMSTELVTLKIGDTLRLADDIMNLAKIRHFPVLDDDRVAGVIDQADLLHASLRSLVKNPKESLRQALGTVAVKEVMMAPTTVSADTSIGEAARIMVDKNVECLLVMQDGRLAGLVSRTDLLKELVR